MIQSPPDSPPVQHGEIVARPRETAVSSPSASPQPSPEGGPAAAAKPPRNWPGNPRRRRRCAPTKPTGPIFRPGARRKALSRCRPRPRSLAPTSPAWRTVTVPRRSGGGCPRSVKCTVTTTCPGTPRMAPSRDRSSKACCQPTRPSTPKGRRLLSLAMLRQLLATCDRTARGRRDRALLLVWFRRRAPGTLRTGVSPRRGRGGGRERTAPAHSAR